MRNCPPHISDGQSHPSLRNPNKKTTLCILSLCKFLPERDSNQDTASSIMMNPLMAAPALEDCPSGPAIYRQHHTSSPSAPNESLPLGSSEAWPTWSSLNGIRTGDVRCKVIIGMQKMGCTEDGQIACQCGDEQTL